MKDLLQKHIDGLKKLAEEGFEVGYFALTVNIKRGDEEVEFIIKPPDKWTEGAGVVAANRNCYHHGKDPHEAYHKHAKDKAKKKKKGKKHEEAAEMLIKVLDSLAAKAHVVMKKKQPYMSNRKTKDVHPKKGWTVWTVHIADQYYRNIQQAAS